MVHKTEAQLEEAKELIRSRKLPGSKGPLTADYIYLTVVRFNEKVAQEKYWRPRITLAPGWEEECRASIPLNSRGNQIRGAGRISILLEYAVPATTTFQCLIKGKRPTKACSRMSAQKQ